METELPLETNAPFKGLVIVTVGAVVSGVGVGDGLGLGVGLGDGLGDGDGDGLGLGVGLLPPPNWTLKIYTPTPNTSFVAPSASR